MLLTPQDNPEPLAGCPPVGFIATTGADDPSVSTPWDALLDAGGQPELISPDHGYITTLAKQSWQPQGGFTVDWAVEDADPERYAALIVPGGVFHADALRNHLGVRALIREFVASGKPVVTIGHAIWIVMSADLVRGHRVTAPETLAQDVEQAGAHWVDAPLVRSGNLITVRGNGSEERRVLVEELLRLAV